MPPPANPPKPDLPPGSYERFNRLFLQWISVQSSVFAGFTFAGLIAYGFRARAETEGINIAFFVAACVATALFLVSSFAAGILYCISRMMHLAERFEAQTTVAWIAYIGGVVAFMVALTLLAWAKVPHGAAVGVTAIASLAISAMVLFLYWTGKRAEQMS